MTVVLPALLATVSAVVLAVAAFAGGWIVTAAAGLCVLALAAGWADLLRLPHRSGTTLLVGGLGLGALVAGTLAIAPDRGVPTPLAVFAAVIAIAVLSAFGHELLRRDGRRDVVESMTGTVTGQVMAVLAVGWVLLAHTTPGSSATVVAAAGVVASRLVGALPLPVPGMVRSWLGVGAGLAGALGASFGVPGVPALTAVAVGVAVAGIGLAVDHLFGPVTDRQPGLSLLARAAAPVAGAGTLAYAVVRIGSGYVQ